MKDLLMLLVVVAIAGVMGVMLFKALSASLAITVIAL